MGEPFASIDRGGPKASSPVRPAFGMKYTSPVTVPTIRSSGAVAVPVDGESGRGGADVRAAGRVGLSMSTGVANVPSALRRKRKIARP